MKNAILSLASLFLLASAFVSCKKDENPPSFMERLVGEWKSEKITVSGTDQSNSFSFLLKLEEDKDFELDIATALPIIGNVTQSFDGDWSEDENKQEITLRYTDGDKLNWDVKELSDDSMTAEALIDNLRYQVIFERQ